MDPLWVGVGSICLLLVLLFGGVYVGVALGLSGVLGMIAIMGFGPGLTLLATTFFTFGTNYAFIVIPLFIAMGLFAAESEISKDAYDTLTKWLGRTRGGLGLATVGAATLFGTLTGSSIVTSIVFAKLSVPEMIRHGYSPRIAYGLVSAAGSIGMMIPPSLLAVVYALLTELSVGQLLMAGIGPGLVLALCLGGGLVGILTLRPSLGPPSDKIGATWKERFFALPKLWPAFVVAVIVIGGMYSGVFTANEAAGVGTFALFILFLISKKLSRQAWPLVMASLRDSLSTTAMILLILVSAQVFSRLLVLSGIGRMMTSFIGHAGLTPLQFVIAATLLYLVLGCFIDSISILAITIPIFQPVVLSMGIDPIWFAMTMIVATQMGTITPPMGLCVYAVKGVAGPTVSLEEVFRGSLPFFFFMLIAQVIIIAFPMISTWIPYNLWK